MEVLINIFDFVLHFDRYLTVIIQSYGAWTYIFLFLIIYCETGLVVTPFLPGDSLLFVAGTLAAVGAFEFKILVPLFIIAAIGGNTQNYYIGRLLGNKAFAIQNSRLIKKDYLLRTQAFYDKHGRKTILISRFMPILRTFAPFVAGIGKMSYWKFMISNIAGGTLWVLSFLTAGYFFGTIPGIKKNFTLVIIAIIIISLLPSVVVYVRRKFVKVAGS